MANQLWARKPLEVLLEEMKGDHRLRRVLGPVQLTSLGVGAIIGAGIFVATGAAAHNVAGPALMVSYVIAGITCVFAALCYAEFASMAPVAGSAFTYAYATLGELFAWIIGWDLVLEYAVGSATVANGWSSFFQSLLPGMGIHLPDSIRQAPIVYDATAGHFVRTNGYVNLPAVIIVLIVTAVLVKGIQESATFNATMVGIKIAAVLFVIIVGAFYINTANWEPFAPYGWGGLNLFGYTLGSVSPGGTPVGMLAGSAIIFFAYIGFDSVSTHAEEARRPNRDVPIGIVASLIICTVLYVLVVVVLTGMVKYTSIDTGAGVSTAFKTVGLNWAEFIIAAAGVAGITSVLLVMMLSGPRVFLAMARDGLVPPKFFADVHPRFRTPWKTTILIGCFVAVGAGLLPIDALLQMTNIGTLFAFTVVCIAVLIMRRTHPNAERPFRCPMVPLVPILGVLMCLMLMFSLPWANWVRLIAWLLIGLAIYFTYSYKRSVMAQHDDSVATVGSVATLGLLGFLLGAFIGFLLRPTVPLINAQLPFGTVLTRGSSLTGADQVLVPLAQTSFNYLLAGAVIGTVVGAVLGYFISRLKVPPGTPPIGALAHEISAHGVSPGGALVDDINEKDKAHPDNNGK